MLWEAWSLAKTYRVLPSEIYAIQDEVAAWCFNRAVRMFGTELEAEMEESARGAKSDTQAQHRRQAVFARWTGTEVKFRDPAAGQPAAGSGPVQL